MKNSLLLGSFFALLLVALTTACAPIKTLEVWKDDSYNQPIKKVLVVGLARAESIRGQFENILAYELSKHGVVAIPSNTVLPNLGTDPDRDAVVAKVKALGVDSVLVARSINEKDITNHQFGGVVTGGVAVYDGSWHGYAYGYSYDKQYDTDYFTVSTRVYDVDAEKPVWSYISQIKVKGSRQGAVEAFIPNLVEQLKTSQLIK